jgi:hypothetical protein
VTSSGKHSSLFLEKCLITRGATLFNTVQGLLFATNERKSAASFCRQVATLVPAMFCNFYLVKNPQIADFESLEFRNFLMHV